MPETPRPRAPARQSNEAISRLGFHLSGMAPGPLREDQDQDDDGNCQHLRGDRPAELESPFGDWLVEEVADGRAKRSRQMAASGYDS